MNKVRVYDETGRFDKMRPILQKLAKASLKRLKKKNLHLEVFLIDGRRMRAINRRFRGKDKAAAVLSFPERGGFPHPEAGPGYSHIGEVYLAPGFILSRGEDARRMLVHGLLHLLRYTHKGKNDRIRMEKAEELITKTEGRKNIVRT